MYQMDKKKEINFNLNNFLLALSLAFDHKNQEKFGNSLIYSKRVTFIALKIAQKLNLSPEEMADLCSYSLSHSIASLKIDNHSKEYYECAEKMIERFPFLLKNKNILKYQREYYNGSGIFKIKDSDIPLLSKILSFSIELNNKFDLLNCSIKNKNEIKNHLESNRNILFSNEFIDIFLELSNNIAFWQDLQNENDILNFIFMNLHDFTKVLSFEELLELCSVIFFSINSESNLLKYCEKLCDFYKFVHKDKLTFMIAASVQNIGKLFIPKTIIEKNQTLNEEEYEIIKSYPYFTKKILLNIMGFNDICSWASKVQETINATGYPYSLSGKDLSLKDRLLASLVAYDALRLNKPYRKAYTHKASIKILKEMANSGKLDSSVVDDLDFVLK